jgi:hypothetical protein
MRHRRRYGHVRCCGENEMNVGGGPTSRSGQMPVIRSRGGGDSKMSESVRWREERRMR